MANGKIKLIDLDFMKNVEQICFLSSSNKDFKPCPFYLKCQELNDVDIRFTNCQAVPCEVGVCRGTNLRYNLNKINKIFFKVLLKPKYFPSALNYSLSRLLKKGIRLILALMLYTKKLRTLAYRYLRTTKKRLL